MNENVGEEFGIDWREEPRLYQQVYREIQFRRVLLADPVGAFLDRWVLFTERAERQRGPWPAQPLYCCERELWVEIEEDHDDDCPRLGLE